LYDTKSAMDGGPTAVDLGRDLKPTPPGATITNLARGIGE
jgi:hypothetical protein